MRIPDGLAAGQYVTFYTSLPPHILPFHLMLGIGEVAVANVVMR
jgi:hypothetical protein